jgi:AraC-like DNA-binding protein
MDIPDNRAFVLESIRRLVTHTPTTEATTIVAGVELPCGRFDALWADHFAMRYPPHFHDTWAIGVVEEGLLRLRTARGEWVGGPGTILAFAPGEIHSAAALSASGYRYRMVYPRSELIRGISAANHVDAIERPFQVPVFTDHELAGKLATAHQPLIDGQWDTKAESELVAALRSLWRDYRTTSSEWHDAQDLHAVERARDYIGVRFAKQVRLASIAAECGLSAFQLIRVFQRVLGVSPYAYLVQLRVNRARDMLHQGVGVSEVAYACGFSDQSHLTRVFKKAIGVPPGTYQKAVRERAA